MALCRVHDSVVDLSVRFMFLNLIGLLTELLPHMLRFHSQPYIPSGLAQAPLSLTATSGYPCYRIEPLHCGKWRSKIHILQHWMRRQTTSGEASGSDLRKARWALSLSLPSDRLPRVTEVTYKITNSIQKRNWIRRSGKSKPDIDHRTSIDDNMHRRKKGKVMWWLPVS